MRSAFFGQGAFHDGYAFTFHLFIHVLKHPVRNRHEILIFELLRGTRISRYD